MKILKFKLIFLFILISCFAFAQQPALTNKYIGVGNSSDVLSGSSSLKYDNGTLTVGSTTDNYISFPNGAGTGSYGFDANGHFGWWTPSSTNSRKMTLSNTGQLKIGTALANGYSYGDQKLQVDGGTIFYRNLTNSDISLMGSYTNSNNYILNGNMTASAYHAAQSNYFQANGGNMGGYQSSAQQNWLDFNNVNYTDWGYGHVWSVQTNTFQLSYGNATSSKVINSYIRTAVTPGSSVGTYYSLFLEAPVGNGTVSQLGNYWGLYQESADAKNFLAGKVGIGTSNMSDTAFKLFVDKGIRTRKVKVDVDSWADYVFEPEYKLASLKEVESYIKINKHLPGVMSAKEVEVQGLDLGENQATLLKKIEELTLYVIDLQKQNDAQNKKIAELELNQIKK